MKRSLLKMATLVCGWLIAQPALSAKALVDVDAGLTGINISASISANADSATLWSTLTDYNRLAEFVPNLVVSRIISTPGRPIQVEQKADSGVLSFAIPDHIVLAMEERPPNLIRFRAISGAVISMKGEWRIEGSGMPLRLVYRARVLPMVPPPPYVADGIIRDEIASRLEAVVREAERRARKR